MVSFFAIVHIFSYQHKAIFEPLLGLCKKSIEKTFFPTTLLILVIFKLWWWLGLTIAIETVISVILLTLVSNKGERFEYFIKGWLATPMRYASILYDLYTMGRFAVDIWITRNKGWRK